MQMYLLCVNIFPKFSAMQQAELLRVITTYGRNITAILENFNWDADTHAKLQSAYKEAGKNYRCSIERQQVRHVILQLPHRSGLACTLVYINAACATPTILVYRTYICQPCFAETQYLVGIAIHEMRVIYKTFAMSIQALCLSA